MINTSYSNLAAQALRPQSGNAPKASADSSFLRDAFTPAETSETSSVPMTALPARAPENVELRKAFDQIYNAGGPAEAALLDDNAQSWNARWRVMESAQDSIHAQYFCWDTDVFGMALMGFMYKKAAHDNVKIKLMVDSTGDTFGTRGFKSHIGGKDYLQELVETDNVEAKVYHPHWKKVIDQALAIGSTAIAASNHDKILEVDGKRGITGGRNIGYEYYAHPDDFSGSWRDTDIAFEGEATAHALRQAFNVEFGAPWITQDVHKDFLGNWVKRDVELIGAYAIMDTWLKDQPLDRGSKAVLRGSEEARAKAAEELLEKVLERLPKDGAERTPNSREMKSLKKLANEMVKYPEMRGTYNAPKAAVREGEVKILDKTSTVGVGTDQINSTLLDLTRAAKTRIVIENPYVVLTDSLIDALREAGNRGVEIWLGTNSPASTDSAVTQAFFLEDWPKLEATIPNLHIFTATGERKLHAKTAVFDDVVSVVGSFNLDFLSQQVNSEIAAVVWSPDFAQDLMVAKMRDHADPANAVVEYTIKRDQDGTPVRSDGKPVLDAAGQLINEPEITYGPDNHMSAETMEKYEAKRNRWNFLRKVLPQLQPLETLKVHSQGDTSNPRTLSYV